MDPFSSVAEEAPAGPAVPAEVSSSKVVISMKGGGGFEAPWVTVHANTPGAALEQLRSDDIRPLMDATAEAANYLNTRWSDTSGGGNAPAQRGAPQAQQPQGPPSGVDQQHCEHGAMNWKSSFSKRTGKPYKGFFCPQDVCKPSFM